MSKKKCAYCGAIGETTKDHVIPRSIFGTKPPKTPELVTVRACDSCNQAYSADEEVFWAFVSTGVADEHPVVGQDTRPGKLKRMFENNDRLKNEFFGNLEPALLQLHSGLTVTTKGTFIDSAPIQRVLEKMALGLYRKVRKRNLPLAATLQTFHGIPDRLVSLIEDCWEINFGNGIVRVRLGFNKSDPSFMLCWFCFYNDKSFTVRAYRGQSSNAIEQRHPWPPRQHHKTDTGTSPPSSPQRPSPS